MIYLNIYFRTITLYNYLAHIQTDHTTTFRNLIIFIMRIDRIISFVFMKALLNRRLFLYV